MQLAIEFTEEEVARFKRRYEEGYDVTSDERYNCDPFQGNPPQRGVGAKNFFLTYRYFDGRRSSPPSLRAIASTVVKLHSFLYALFIHYN